MKKSILFVLGLMAFTSCGSSTVVPAQTEPSLVNNEPPGYWQQHVDYKMEIDMNVENYQYKGKQELVYTNNSPDVLNRVFYHLYFNAFQPGSDMDIRSRTIADPDSRVLDRIARLKPSEIGYIKVNSLTQNGVPLAHKTVGTILEVQLNKSIQPGEKVVFNMDFDGQVPVQIRRAGRNNKEGVALSMTQWYPKLAEYDFEGWHADSYIGREFHGVWGNFDVKLTIDKEYTVGGTGYLQNPNEIGHGYETGKINRPPGDKLTWHFVAPNVHDFTWVADPDYIHDTKQVPNGPMLHFLYKDNDAIKGNWKELQSKTVALMEYFSENIGKYPYKQYSVLQGGDGGMEYAMCTLITGERSFSSLVGVTAHELAHTWFQFLLATNEAKHEWMDEGFTSYISAHAKNEVMNLGQKNPNKASYSSYYKLVYSGIEQPQTTHADRYKYNSGYGDSAYSKGALFLSQLGYIIGEENLKATIKKYFEDWAFKHPTPNAILRSAEKVSGMELDWYLTDWTMTTNVIDYAVKNIESHELGTLVTLGRIGLMPMPIDIEVEYTNGSKEIIYIPLTMMRGRKPAKTPRLDYESWSWANPSYAFIIDRPRDEIKSITIDPKDLMADINKFNNKK